MSPMRVDPRPIRFWFRGRIVSVADVPITRTVLQWLREDQHAMGTKEGCGEGDCGACTVVLGSRDDDAPDGVRLQAVNSCIQFLASLDGKALFTVEDLAKGNELHPVQQAMVDLHGSQCGFCTPGIVMSLWANYENRSTPPSREEVEECLSGNLCRCTGYRPIVDAARAAWQSPARKLDRHPLRQALDELAALPFLRYEQGGHSFSAPRDVASLATLCEAMPEARLLAGSTDVGLWVTKQLRELGDVILVSGVAELKEISRRGDFLEIGAAVSLTDAFDALIEAEPAWAELALRFASVPVRNAGTLGGNVANGSPIGDSMPGLIAMGAQIVLQKGSRIRELPLEDFYLGYQKKALEPGEFVRAIRMPIDVRGRTFRIWKVSKRVDQDISAVCGAISLTRDIAGAITEARIAFGGMAAMPKRASQAETALVGSPLTEFSVRAAMAVLDSDFAPISDMRASSAYRLQVAKNLLWRLWLEIGKPRSEGEPPLRLSEIPV